MNIILPAGKKVLVIMGSESQVAGGATTLPEIATPATAQKITDKTYFSTEKEITTVTTVLIKKPIPMNEMIYVTYDLRGEYGAMGNASIANNALPWFYIEGGNSSIDITDSNRYAKNIIPFALDEALFISKGAKVFTAGTTYTKDDTIIIAPTQDITAKDDTNVNYTFLKGKKYTIRVNMATSHTSLANLLVSSWKTSIAILYRVGAYGDAGKRLWINNLKVSQSNPLAKRNLPAINLPAPTGANETGQYSIDKHGVMSKDNTPFFPFTIYEQIDWQLTGTEMTAAKARLVRLREHGWDGMHCHYGNLPLCEEAGMPYNVMKWGTSGGPVMDSQIVSPRSGDKKAWNTVFSLSRV